MKSRAIGETRVSSPSHSLVMRKLPRPLAFEEEDGFGESVFVVVLGDVVTMVVSVEKRRGRRRRRVGGAIAENDEEREDNEDSEVKGGRRKEKESHFSLREQSFC